MASALDARGSETSEAAPLRVHQQLQRATFVFGITRLRTDSCE